MLDKKQSNPKTSGASERSELSVNTTVFSWVVATLVLLQYAMVGLARNIWSTSIPIAAPTLGISMTAAGGLMTAYSIGYGLSNLVTGFAADAYGPRKTLFTATMLTGLLTLVIPFVNGYPAIFALRVGIGLASGPLFACMVKYQISYFSKSMRATAMGFMLAGSPLGTSVSAAVFAPIVQTHGWKQGFIYTGVIVMAMAVVFVLFAKERIVSFQSPRAPSRRLSPIEKQAERSALRAIITKKSFVIGTIACIIQVGVNSSFNTWIISFFTIGRGFSLAAAGAIVGAADLTRLFASTLAGATADLLKTKKKVAGYGGVVVVICTLLLMSITSTPALWVVMLLRSLVASFTGTPLNALQAQAATGNYAGRAMGIYNGIAQIGSVVLPTLFGLILDISGMNYAIVMGVMAILLAVVAILVLCMDESTE